jgi:hypothetical protein
MTFHSTRKLAYQPLAPLSCSGASLSPLIARRLMVRTIKFFGNMALTGDMEYFPVGELKVSAIGIGCWQASDDWSTTNDDNIIGALRRSYELGVNLIDTAAAYGDGHSETVVSRATKDIARGNLVVATKVAAPISTSPTPVLQPP